MDFRGLNESGVASQLKTLGLTDQRQLFRRLPQDLLFPSFDLPEGTSEQELESHFRRLLQGMTAHGSFPPQRSFVGGGYYYHYIPASVNAIGSDGSFSTAYTPYQAEASQGTL